MAQNSVNMGSQTSITSCNTYIYDDGGPNGRYGSHHNYTLTVYPEAGQGRIFLEIINLDIHHNDTLFIYDGTNATGTPLATLNNDTYNDNLNTGIFMATETNTSGALTLRFKTSYFFTNHGNGFKIHASCVAACSPFQIALDSAHCSHLPVLHPDGFSYIDLCPNEEVHLAVKGLYPNQQTAGYNQNDGTTTFWWFLEPTVTLSGAGMDSISHVFTSNQGEEVNIMARDTLSCPAQYPITFRVRTSQNPIQHISDFPPLCLGQTFTPEIGYENAQGIVLEEITYSQHASLKVSDTVFLPDGISCPPYGIYYRSNVTFSEFEPGTTITSANDIQYVRIKMEHSAIEDLKIEIICPNGHSCTILPYPNFESIYDYSTIPATPKYFRVNMGSAYRPDGGTCSSALNPMGEPWNYIWSNNSSLGYQYASSNGGFFSVSNFHGHYNPHWDTELSPYFDSYHSYSVDSSNMADMTQIYHPYQSFNSLIGCPLNGNWYIQVQDMLENDNGYIVEWELALDPDLLPSLWEYSIGVDTFYFTGDQVLNNHTLQPQTAGNPTFGLTLIDDSGCQYDTTFQIAVHERPEVNLGEDLYVCPGTSVYLHPTPSNSTYQYTWNTGSTATGFYTSEPGTYSVTVSPLGEELTCASSDTVELHNFIVSDTTFLWDTICQGYDYEEYGFSMSAEFLSQMFNIHPSWPISWFTGSQTCTDHNGCDSIVLVYLTVYRHWQNEQTVFACEQYIWDGDTLKESGDYVKDFVSEFGCDSTVTLHLSIGHPIEGEVWETSCGSYHWLGETLIESGDYTKIIPSSHDCDSTVTIHLTVLDTTLITYNSNPNFCNTGETTLAVEGNFDNYVWSTGEVTPSIEVTSSGYYSVTASNYACERSVGFHIPTCIPILLLPNAITPSNQDGLNDFFRLSDYDRSQIVDFQIYIYNRWGELVFVSEDKHFEWDGSINGKRFINMIYSYVLRCTDHNGKAYRVVGDITVL
jgi:gliding motility-associated-like protein